MFHPGSEPKSSEARPKFKWRNKLGKPATATPPKKRASTLSPQTAVLSPTQMLKQRICCDVCTHDDILVVALREVSGDLVKGERLLRQLHQQHESVGHDRFQECLRLLPAHSVKGAVALLGIAQRHPNLTPNHAATLKGLVDMGFEEAPAFDALLQTSGDTQAAIELLRAAVTTKAFSECAYLAAYKRIAAPTQTYELLAKIHSLCRLFVASKRGMQCEADDFFNRLQCKIDSRHGHLANPGLAATRMWSTVEILYITGARAGQYEFCHLLNQVLRDDVPGPMLDCAVLVARAINRHCVQGSYTGWPNGPDGTEATNRRSDVKDTTFRSGGLRRDLRGWYVPGRSYRSNMFVASSFTRAVAQTFEIQAGASCDKDPVMWIFKFEHEDCLHVNFLRQGAESICKENEFLLCPGSVLTVEAVAWSSSLEERPHEITLRVASDNTTEPESLPLSPWC
jgi:hypothetical protein